MNVEWSADALADVAGILEHLPDEIASNTAEGILQAEANIRVFPLAAHYHVDLDVYERYVPKTRVILVYRITEALIEIVSAFHTSRDDAGKL